MTLLKALHTVRHLRQEQILGQIRRRSSWLWERPERFARRCVIEPYPGCRWQVLGDLLPPPAARVEADALRAGHVCFLNQPRHTGWPPCWRQPGATKLWHYNLHYFEYLWALDYAAARQVVDDWIGHYPLRRGQVGWEPYPTSLRLMHWCAVFFHRHRQQLAGDTAFRERLWRSLALQGQWLTAHLETHLLGNHLLENAAALCLLGNCFGGSSARGWAARGRQVLERELDEQVLPDGMHFERSPMYHLRCMTVLAWLIRGGGDPEGRLRALLARMTTALDCLCHPDGRIALVNDSAWGIMNPAVELHAEAAALTLAAAAPPTRGGWALPDAGYYGYRDDAGTYLLCDAGPLGPDYMPGHGHADIFSFELSLAGRRVITDTGVHDYSYTPLRRYCRGTRGHNTVEIEGRDQSELWAVFRVARRGRPREVRWHAREDGFDLAGWHDGYERLAGGIHERRFEFQAPAHLAVRDRIRAGRKVTVRSRLHLHPDCRLLRVSGDEAEVDYGAGRLRVAFHGPGRLVVEPGPYCPEFGRAYDRPVLVREAEGASLEMGFSLRWNGATMRV